MINRIRFGIGLEIQRGIKTTMDDEKNSKGKSNTKKAGPGGGRRSNMTLIIMFVLAVALTIVAYKKGSGIPLVGLKAGGRLFLDILPTLVLAFIVAGMIGQVLPRDLMSKWLGEESGIRGLVLGTLAGSFTPGGPFVQFPIVAALLNAGAGIAPLMAYISAWSLLGVNRFLIYEMPLLGWKLAVSRMAASLIFPVILGLLTRWLFIRL
jgi:uncharacterized membrane protein YraQ (UPF0718 family)